MTRANDASVSFSRELRAGKRIEFDERLSGYEIDDHSLSPIDSVALTIMRPPKSSQKGQVLDPSWTLQKIR